MLGIKNDLFIYGGPSLELVPQHLLDYATVLSPVKRGDLEELGKNYNPSSCLIVDGLFGGNMSVTPTECRQLLENGWALYGCSSMGALRAADLWSQGMMGFGYIYNLYRLNHLKSDADVAVIYEKDESNQYKELTVSIAHLLYLFTHLRQDGVSALHLNQMLLAARQIFWVDRTWPALFEAWNKNILYENIRTRIDLLKDLSEYHPKKIDALDAMKLICHPKS